MFGLVSEVLTTFTKKLSICRKRIENSFVGMFSALDYYLINNPQINTDLIDLLSSV